MPAPMQLTIVFMSNLQEIHKPQYRISTILTLKKMKKVSIFKNGLPTILFCLILVFGKFSLLQAQCVSQSLIYAAQSTTIPYCATGPCASQNISIDMGAGCANIVAPFTMEVLGGIELVTSGTPIPNINIPIRVGNVFTIAVRAIPGSLCKGRVILRYWRSTDPCNDGSSYPVANQVFIDVFKSGLNASVLNPIYAATPNLGGIFRIIAESPACVTPTDIFNLSVLSVFNRTVPNNCLAAGIGLDEINWELPAGFTLINSAGDKSNITVRAPAVVPASNLFKVFIGRANSTAFTGSPVANATITLNGGIADNYISVLPLTGTVFTDGLMANIVSGPTVQAGSACMPINRGGTGFNTSGTRIGLPAADRFRLRSEISGATYLWTLPAQGFWIEGSSTAQEITVIADNKNLPANVGASGVFSCRATPTTGCANSTATFAINRSLVAGYNVVSVTPAPNPAGPGTTAGLYCFKPDETYTFTLSNAPLNTRFTWANLNTTVTAWNIFSGANDGPSIQVRPVVVGGVLTLPLNVKATSCNPTINFQVNGNDPQVAGNPLNLDIINSGTGTLAVNTTGSNPTDIPNWYTSFPNSTTLCGGTTSPTRPSNASDFTYTWSFISGTDEFGAPITALDFFPNEPNPLGSFNAVNVNPGNFAVTVRVVITSRNITTPRCYLTRCFSQTITKTFGLQAFRKAVSGETAEESISKQVDGLRLSPNPSSGEVSVGLKGIEKGGSLRIMNGMQRTVQKSPLFEGGNVQLKGLPAGIYTVEYISPNGKRFAEKLSVK